MGLDSFWEEADRSDSGEHPLERELGDRLDALARYRRLIDDAEANGQDGATEHLLEQFGREEQLVRQLTEAMQRLHPPAESA